MIFDVMWSRPLGGGGEGIVYLGRCLRTGEYYALKFSTSNWLVDARRQLAQEFARVCRAGGDGVVRLVAYNLTGPRPFLAFELARSGSLADEMASLRKNGQVYHPAAALQRVRALLVSIARVHARGLVHRDIKPANILRFGHLLKLADFGAGRSLARPVVLQTRAFVGTREYAAPEQILLRAVDHRADIYAAGAILYEMLTGIIPVFGTRVVTPASWYSNITPGLEMLLARLLSVLPWQRPPSAAAAIREIDAVLHEYMSRRRVYVALGLASPF